MLVKRIICLALLQLTLFAAKAQCPQIFDYLGNPSASPMWISCTGGAYNLNFQSPSNFPGTYTISWGDASPDFTGTNYIANTVIPHLYGATTGSFLVTLTIPAQTCTMTGVVVMEQAVVAGLSTPVGGTLAGCTPANITFSNTSTNVSSTTQFLYIWGDSSPNTPDSYTNTSASHVYTASTIPCQTSATLMAWNYCSFSATSTAVLGPISVYARDIAQITTSVQNRCWPDNAWTFTNTSSQNCVGSGNNYQRKQYWKLGNYWAFNSFQDSIYPWQNIPPNTPVTVAFPNLGGYVVWLKDSNVCGVDSVSQLVNLFNAPTASMVAPAGPFCVNTLMTFTNASSVGVFYKWDMGDGSGFINFPFGPKTYSYATAGTYTVKLVAYIPFGGACSDTDQVVINVVGSPVASFTMNPNQSCVPLTVNWTNTSIPPTTAWFWDFGNLSTSTSQNPPATTYTASGVYTVMLVVTNPAGCQGQVTHTVQVDALPTGSFVSDVVCVGGTTSFTNLTTNGTNYIWNFGDATPNSFAVNPVHTFSAAGVYTVTLFSFNAFCSNTYTNTVLVASNATANFAFTPTAGCAPLLVTFTNTSVGAVSYQWDFGDASPTTTVITPTHAYVSPTVTNQTYTISLIAQNASGCGTTMTKTVTLFANPLPGFTFSPKGACTPFNVTFTNTSSGGTTYKWDLNYSITATSTNASQTYTNAPGSGPQSIPVKLIVTNAGGCKDSITDFVTVFAQPQSGFIVDSAVCHPKALTFTNTSTGATTYSWNFGSSSSSTLSIPVTTFTNPGSTAQTSITTLNAINLTGCVHSSTFATVIYPKPNIVYTALPDSGCSPLKVNFPAVNGFTVYNWNLGNSNTATTSSASTKYINFGTTVKTITTTLMATDIHGCADTASKNIKVFPAPTASYISTGSNTLSLPNATINYTNMSVGATSYTWNFGDLTTSNTIDATHIFTTESTYSVFLIASNSQGCKDTFSLGKILVKDESQFQMPNAFTPNQNGSPGTTFDPNDLSNDIFHANMKGVLAMKFTVYSRWGEVMFATEDPTQGWDGYYKGKLCNQDIYVWKIHVELFDGTVIDKTGDVTLIR